MLVCMQAFDGSFPPTARLEAILGRPDCLTIAEGLSVDETVWATVLGVAFLKKHLKDLPDLLDSRVEKAADFVSQTPGVDFENLVARAQEYIA